MSCYCKNCKEMRAEGFDPKNPHLWLQQNNVIYIPSGNWILEPLAIALRGVEEAARVVALQSPDGQAPWHSHPTETPGVWDGGGPCEVCASWKTFKDAIKNLDAKMATL